MYGLSLLLNISVDIQLNLTIWQAQEKTVLSYLNFMINVLFESFHISNQYDNVLWLHPS